MRAPNNLLLKINYLLFSVELKMSFFGRYVSGFVRRKARWRWRHGDRHLGGDSITDGCTRSRQTFLLSKSGLTTDSSSHVSFVRQQWGCPAKWIKTRLWVWLCSCLLLLFVHPSRPKGERKKATLLYWNHNGSFKGSLEPKPGGKFCIFEWHRHSSNRMCNQWYTLSL